MSKKFRVIRPFGDIKKAGDIVIPVEKARIRYLLQSRYIEPIVTDADDGVNIGDLYKIASSSAKKLPALLRDINAGTVKEALKHETRETMKIALLKALEDSS